MSNTPTIALDAALADLAPANPSTTEPTPAGTTLADALSDLGEVDPNDVALPATLGDALADIAPAEEETELSPTEAAVTPGYYLKHGEPGLHRVDTAAEAGEGLLGGAVSSVLETKDFLFGEPEDADKSALRTSTEAGVSRIKEQSILGGVSVGIGQWAAGMYGLGKATTMAKALPWFGKGFKAADAALDATRAGRAATNTAKAATVGVVAFDPHEERLANLIESGPLANPLTRYLAADPTDSAAEGRFKSALESIGLDLAIIGTLAAGAKVYRALRLGDADGAARAAAEGEAQARGEVGVEPKDTTVLDPAVVGPEDTLPSPQTPSQQAGLNIAVEESAVNPASGRANPGLTITYQGSEGEARGHLKANLEGENYAVFRSEVDDDLQGKGLGVELYERLIAEAGARGKAVVSDLDVSKQAAQVYEALKRRGYNVERLSQNVREENVVGRDMLYSEDGQAVYRITPKAPETPAPQAAAIEPDLELGGLGGTEPPRGDIVPAGAEDLGANPTALVEEAAPTPVAPSPFPRIAMSDEDTASVLRGMESDAEAMTTHGGWYQAIESGHTFGRGEGIPYAKLNQDADLDNFMARVTDAAEERIAAIKGGDVLTDANVQRLVNQRATLFNEDPATVLGTLQASGEAASRMVADMEAGYLITSRMLQDTYALAQRIKVGDFSAFGSKDLAVAELKKRLSLASSTYAASRSITANAGRAVRRMRRDFAINPEDIAKLQEMDADRLVEVLDATEGNPRNLARAANPGMWSQMVESANFLLVNSLLSGVKTHIVGAVTGGYMIGARPMERILGSVPGVIAGNPTSRAILKQSVRQYVYTGTALMESFALARKAFTTGDSILAPHTTELYKGAGGKGSAGMAWRPMDSIPNVFHNAVLAATGKGLPIRALGFTDEVVKQTVYRSKVMAKAHMEAAESGAASGLKGAELEALMRQHITARLDAAFDDLGRGTDAEALREATLATFQQDLPQDARIGRAVQAGLRILPEGRLILPFVKTPTNVLRYGWKMTPVLNGLQAEYRDMLMGRMGNTATERASNQAQAVGQMAMGSLFMGSAAFLVSQGAITGGGPKDYKLAQELRATGWQPYSIVTSNADGSKTYTPFNRFDPIALPFGIIADLQDAMATFGDDVDEEGITSTVGSAIGALAIGLAKQFTDKSYLTGVSDALEALSDPEARLVPTLGKMAANFVPFSAGLRQFNQDPYLREARDVADRIMATIPGLSESVPARYDAFGDPITTRKGLWSSDTDALVDREMQRLALENGSAPVRVSPRVSGGVDLRDLTLADGRNAYAAYQEWSGHLPGAPPLKDLVAKLIAGKAYLAAPDGEAGTRGTKLNILTGMMGRYREGAMEMLKRDPGVRGAMMKRDLKVRDAYRQKVAAPVSAERAKRPALGEAFGVELKGLMGAE